MEPGREVWWRDGVVYQIYPRSFADSNGDGIGDLGGIEAHLDHLVWLGVDAVWLSPIYRSPMADFGYDVSDHCAVDPVFGDLATFEHLLVSAHDRGLKVMLDWVPNHTSDQHRWFVESRSSRSSPRRDWYVWRDGRDGAEPNRWRAAFGGPAWTWDDRTAQWYLHVFLPEQPDLNWNNPEVEEAMHGVLRFWLDRGVDGFRADVVHLIGKDPALPDRPDEHDERVRGVVGSHDDPRTVPLLRRIRAVLDRYPGARAMVGEINLHGAHRLAPYYGDGDALHLVFDFSLLRAPWDAERWAAAVEASEAALGPVGGWPAWVIGNHDESRVCTRLGGSEAKARVAATVLLTLRGTPFLYAGDELGLLDADVGPEQRVDPGGRDGCRAPLPWSATWPHGWPATTWLPFAPGAERAAVTAQRDDPASVLHLHRRLLAARRASPALHAGSWARLPAPEGVLAYERRRGDDIRRVVASFGGQGRLAWAGSWRVCTGTDAGHDGTPWDGHIAADHALVLEPT